MKSRCPAARSSTSDPSAVADAVRGVDSVLHLATRIPPFEQASDPGVWHENDRLRTEASRNLVDAAIAAGAAVYVQPTVTFVYPPLADNAECLRRLLVCPRPARSIEATPSSSFCGVFSSGSAS